MTNLFDEVFSELNSIHIIESNDPKAEDMGLLPELGEYHVLGLDPAHPVAVSTLADAELADKIAALKPGGLGVVGKTETENIGIEKIIKNLLAVPSIRYLILCGRESMGHFSGNTMAALSRHGVDEKLKVNAAKGRKPILVNTTHSEIQAFREQVQVIDMINCQDLDEILRQIQYLTEQAALETNDQAKTLSEGEKPHHPSTAVVQAVEKDPYGVKLDRAGYFVILPKAEEKIILVEHYSNTNKLLRIIRGNNARDIYWTILDNSWVTEMSHVAYLGKELTRAELSMELRFKYVQDKA